jgi:hypothetical protein
MGKKLLIITFLLLSSCSLNLYSGLSNTATDTALHAEALKKMNLLDYDSAITIFQSMSAAGQANRDVAYDFASAAAGKCGYDFIAFANHMAAAPADLGFLMPPYGVAASTTPILYYIMSGFTATTIGTTVNGQAAPTAAAPLAR